MNGETARPALSRADLQSLGVMQVAYVRPTVKDGQPLFAVHGADGRLLGLSPSLTAAEAAIRDHDMEVVPLH